MSPHIYLCHPPFKHLSPVSDMYEAKLEASRSYFLVPPPSAPLRVHQWRSDHSPFSSLSPSPYFCWWCWAWSPTPPPRPCSATPPPSSLPSFAGNTYLKQEIYFLIWNWIRSCSSINSPMICYDVWLERSPPLPSAADPLIDWPSLCPQHSKP